MGRRKKEDESPRTERLQIRVFPIDRERIEELIAADYAESISAVIRRSIDETHKAEFFLK